MVKNCDVFVAGGGIMGLSCALELARAGAKVLVADTNPVGQKASWAAAGILVTRGGRKPLSAFRRFYLQSIASYPAWLEGLRADADTAVPLTRGGDHLLFDIDTAEGEKAYHEKCAQLQREEALPWEESDDLPAFLKPFARQGRFKALYFEQESYVQNRLLLAALEKACRHLGVTVVQADSHLIPEGRNQEKAIPWKIQVNQEIVDADQFLITSGSWSQTWLAALGWQSSLVPVKGQVARLHRPWRETAMVHVGEGLYLIPRGEDMIVGATTEPGVWDEAFNAQGETTLSERLKALLPGIPFQPLESWSGLRPRTRDRLPLMGAIPHRKGAWICSGHYKCGVSMAPLAGKCMSQVLLGRKPLMDIEAFDPARKGALKEL